ncbi:3-keto-disaccharide hydrolase [Haloferula sargassicola]|uniref:3-keto-alpha-glucoside-1,2-lyase/3-keto-2-hydroxy-glucal hydratase domain-containing protein n=1 Tax=Haloferula sargassicola TaxID=490096 RepID=A0ABP9ULC4_9BACT
MKHLTTLSALLLLAVSAHAEEGWISLFNGKDLSGWIPKITKHPLGENAMNTFRVEDGMIKVSYDDYGGKFDGQFGHLYSELAYSSYILRLEYRFEGKQLPDGPGFALQNSGVMFHCQPPSSLKLNQDFPVCFEFQFLAAAGEGERATANLCTPATNVWMDGKLVTNHVIPSSAPTFQPGEWVTMELEVHGSKEAIHRINGKEVLRYQQLELDPENGVGDAQALLKRGAPKAVAFGHLALQSESQPVWFRNIEIKPLEE